MDDTTTRPAMMPTKGGGGPVPEDFQAARRRLGRAARQAGERMTVRLRRAIELYDLDRRELVAAQGQIRRLRRAGSLPTPKQYWESTAVPRAGILSEAAIEVVTDESEALGEAIDHFLMATSRSTLEPWISGAEGRAAIQRSGAAAIDHLVGAIPEPVTIDELGEWWQRQLRRRALLRSIPRLVTATRSFESIVAERELELLDSPPWSYGDRLLSAFELAHAEVKAHTTDLADQMSRRVATRARGELVESQRDGPVVIKLTG